MNSSIKRILIALATLFVLVVALLGVLAVFDVVSTEELKDYTLKVAFATLVLAVASFAISLMLSTNKNS